MTRKIRLLITSTEFAACVLLSVYLLLTHVTHATTNGAEPYYKEVDKRVKTVYSEPQKLTDEYVVFMAKLIEHEARGESLEGKIAVGNVLMNRCFGDKKLMKREAFRKNAFTDFEKNYKRIKPSPESLRAARMVLNGHKVVSRGTMYFLNRKTATSHWIEKNCKFVKKIGNHWFYSNKN